MQTLEATKKMTTLALLAAMSILLVTIIHLPIFPVAPYLEYDPADIPIYIGTFLFGPWAGAGLTLIVSLIQGMTVSSGGGPIGILMHLIATGGFALVAGTIYRRMRTRKGAVLALVCGSLVTTIIMVIWNVLLTPLYTQTPRAAVVGLLIPVIIPFNLIKCGINSVATYFVYKPLTHLFQRKEEKCAL